MEPMRPNTSLTALFSVPRSVELIQLAQLEEDTGVLYCVVLTGLLLVENVTWGIAFKAPMEPR